MITFSNIFDFLRKILIGFLSMLVSVPVCVGFFNKPDEPAYARSPESVVFWLVCGIGVFWLAAWLLASWVLTNTFHSFLYIRFSLFTPVTVREARELAPLFSVGPEGKWHPCREVRQLPQRERKAVLFAALERYRQTFA
jgi:hypothetical protein